MRKSVSVMGRFARASLLIAAIALSAPCALPQGFGTAPGFIANFRTDTSAGLAAYYEFFYGNHYPLGYTGNIWTGTVTAIMGREISLSWANKKSKIKTFSGEVISSYEVTWDGKSTMRVSVPVPPQNLIGQKLRVYFTPGTKKVKVGNKTVKVNTNYIFRFVPLNAGKP